MSERVAIVANQRAGRGRAVAVADEVKRLVRARGCDPVEITGESVAMTIERLRDEIVRGVDRVVVIGGDGIIHHVAAVIARHQTTLGIVAVGTGNDIARAFDLPSVVDEAIDVALGRPGSPVDAIRCGAAWVVSVATTGFSADVSSRAESNRLPIGQAVYTLATLRELPRLRTRTARLVIDGSPLEVPFTLLALGNTAWFGGGMRVCPGADPSDGQLDLTIIGDVPRRTFMRVFPRVFNGTHVDHPAVTTRRCATLRIEAVDGDPTDLWGDGELIGPTPVDCEVIPNALRIALPRTGA